MARPSRKTFSCVMFFGWIDTVSGHELERRFGGRERDLDVLRPSSVGSVASTGSTGLNDPIPSIPQELRLAIPDPRFATSGCRAFVGAAFQVTGPYASFTGATANSIEQPSSLSDGQRAEDCPR